MKQSIKACLFGVLSLLTTYSHAVLIEQDYTSAGDGRITYDDSTGLQWLDLSVTSNWSYNDVTSEFGSGGLFEGWRYATVNEFRDLAAEAGIYVPSTPADYYGIADEVIALLTLLDAPGFTPTSGIQSYGTLGQTREEFSGSIPPEPYRDDLLAGFLGLAFDAAGIPIGYFDDLSYSIDPTSASYDGNYLVRVSVDVPEPGTVFLLGIGLFCIGIGRRAQAWRGKSISYDLFKFGKIGVPGLNQFFL
ncbi:MAG: PEP-CTERM sorting domain-containing protein [Gammaproteobacteria bacterium]|nr:PEP-CTERM sorting domain-containing protein [Gammaproteobacteria bacterium]MDH5799240.1 PEP-CTERM sorting domain-containing protein [Gammaproteobacteria bacterium]